MLLSTVSGHRVASKFLICDSQNSLPVFTSFWTTIFGILLSNFISSGNNSFHLEKKKDKLGNVIRRDELLETRRTRYIWDHPIVMNRRNAGTIL